MSDANTRVTVPADQLRRAFAHRLSTMFGREVPLYGLLVQTVMEHNREVLARNPGLGVGLDIEALSAERHGAIRLARPAEMRQVAGMFRVLGMHPVGFYDLTRAPNGKRQPVISTAFRPVRIQELERAPFRMFASLLCVDDARFFPPDLSRRIQEHVRDRRIMSPPWMRSSRGTTPTEGSPSLTPRRSSTKPSPSSPGTPSSLSPLTSTESCSSAPQSPPTSSSSRTSITSPQGPSTSTASTSAWRSERR
jgi:hypothetical protein